MYLVTYLLTFQSKHTITYICSVRWALSQHALLTLVWSLLITGQRVKFKVACLVRQSPLYLADDCSLVSDSTRRSLRSADIPTCVVPRTFTSYGDITVAGPRLWNSLPVQLRNLHITDGLLRWQLTGHLEPWTRRSVTSDVFCVDDSVMHLWPIIVIGAL